MKDVPRSEQFDDIYFSAEDGLAETQHVFIKGNALPEALYGKERFVIAETGFGTGLNFLTVWKLFDETAKKGQTLDFISFEKYPLSPETIKDALMPWADYFGSKIDILCEEYPLRIAGFHRIKLSPQVTLTLIFDDMNKAIPQLNAVVDCWFLDGFTPAKNPDMWTDILFQNMARLSAAGARFASFTAAGEVRRGLEKAGFSVEKQKGFGRKREMIIGRFNGIGGSPALKFGSRVAIIGGGLAGTSCAYILKQYGFDPIIYEREAALATGASGNSVGLYNPRFCAQRDATSDFYVPAFAQLIRLAKKAGEKINYNPCGALHLMNTPEKERRFHAVVKKWMWHPDHIRFLSPQEASAVSGVRINEECLYLPDSGSVSPYQLCHFMAQGIETRYLHPVQGLSVIEETDAVILCNAHDVQNFMDWLPLLKVRGQLTEIETPDILQDLTCNIHYGGYVSATHNSRNMIGATFQKWVESCDVTQEDHQQNISKLKEALPFLNDKTFKIKDGRAAFRTEVNDHFPVVGPMPHKNNVFISTAFGSHGLVGTVQSAHYIADLLRGGPLCLPQYTVKALAPQRFLDRLTKKHAKFT